MNQRSNGLRLGPLALRIVRLSELVPALLVHRGDSREVVFEDGLVEEDQELIVSINSSWSIAARAAFTAPSRPQYALELYTAITYAMPDDRGSA